jgi:hypothetical protein
MSEAEDVMAIHLGELGIEFIREFKFFSHRKWRLDFYLIEYSYGVEIEGAIWSRGRHTRGQGFRNDTEKYNHATVLGIKMLRFTTESVLKGDAKKFISFWLKEKAA